MPFSRIKAVYKAENHYTKISFIEMHCRKDYSRKIDYKFYKENFWESISNYDKFLN